MKQARVELILAKGTKNGHAFYDNWESHQFMIMLLPDNIWFSAKHEMINNTIILSQMGYAEDPNYISKVKN
jgi:hypothetical protein